VELDRLKTLSGQEVVVFSVDSGVKHQLLSQMVRYYGITSIPAVIINGKAVQGRVAKAEELLQVTNA
jgi:hypothetical protein